MRKETHKIVSAFIQQEPATAARTTTDGATIWLHGNRIAWRENGQVYATLAGWPTVTTRERLNGLCSLLDIGKGFTQMDRTQYYGGTKIDADTVVRLL